MNEPHYITKNIRSFYLRRIVFPLLFLLFLGALSMVFPLRAMLFAGTVGPNASLPALYSDRERYVYAELKELYFTGYTKRFLGYTSGYYDYTMMDGTCVIVLLSPSTSSLGSPTIDDVYTKFEIQKNASSTGKLLSRLAQDLSWSEQGINDTVSSFMLSEPGARGPATLLLEAILILSFFYAAVTIVLYLVYIIFPPFSPPVMALRKYGRPRTILYKAERELSTLPQLATEDMFITEHYFIETSGYGTAIVPIDEILWIYKYSTLHKFLWHHFSISYTLHITANKRQHIACPKNIKSDIDGIMDYLAEANHSILVGFSEENRLKVEELQGDFVLLQKFLTFLSRRV